MLVLVKIVLLVEMVLVEKEVNFKVMQRLTSFRLTNAHCYDPNEESRIRRVVSAVGEARFNTQISRLTDTLCDKIQARIRHKRRAGGSGGSNGSAGARANAGSTSASRRRHQRPCTTEGTE